MGILSKLSKNKQYRDVLENVSEQKSANHLSTGSYALNGILSGNTKLGVPEDAIIALCGGSNSGKSFVLAHIVKSAIDAGYEVLLFDSERAVRKDYYESIGCDTTKMFRIPVCSALDFRNKAFELIEKFYSEASETDKLFVGLDSLGNLASDKELVDTEKNKTNSDQGSNAKFQNSAFRVISSLASKYNFPCVFTNHVYAAIGDMYAQRGKISGGGKSIYNSHIILYFERLNNKEEVSDALGKITKVPVGIKMKVSTIKNREYPEEQTVYLNLRYDTGLNKYSGLLPWAIRAGVLENKTRGFLVTATGKTVFEKNVSTEEIFNEDALVKIDNWLSKNGYSSLSDIFSDEVAVALGETDGETKD